MGYKPVSAPSIREQLEEWMDLSNEFEDALIIAIDALQWARAFHSEPETVAKIVDVALEKLAKFTPNEDGE
jgi:hypothetical protein